MSKNNLEIITLDKQKITDFAFERNKLLEDAKSDWVFFVDSDEVITPELNQEVRSLLSKTTGLANGYYVKRKNYFLGKHIGTDNILRLGRKNKGRWQRQVHEIWKIDGEVGQLKSPLIHNTAKSLYIYISKINNYAKLHAMSNKDEGKKSNLFKIITFPIFKFIQSIIIGRGVVFSILSAFHSFLAWSELWLNQKK